MSERPACFVCRRPTYDPDKRERPWARGVADGGQVLVCPTCQVERPEWVHHLDHCPECRSTRLSLTLGELICRECGHVGAPA